MKTELSLNNIPKDNNTRIALIWHKSAFSTNLASGYRWDLIDNKEQFLNTDFDVYEQIILLAELKWDGFGSTDMTGLKIAYKLSLESPELIRKMLIVTLFSEPFLEKWYFFIYQKSIASTRIVLHFTDFIKYLSPTGVIPNVHQAVKSAYQSLWGILVDYHCHDISIADLIPQAKTELTTIEMMENQKLNGDPLGVCKNKFIPLLFKIKYAYERILEDDSPAIELDDVKRPISIIKEKMADLKPIVNTIFKEFDALAELLEKEPVITVKIVQRVRKLKKCLIELDAPFKTIRTIGLKIRIRTQLLS